MSHADNRTHKGQATMQLKVGQRLVSLTDATAVIVISASLADVSLTCGGIEMVEPDSTAERRPILDGENEGGRLGKRYTDEAGEIEILCTKAGEGTLRVNGQPLVVKVAKALPSSD
jgi:hypothetical protein